MIVFILIVAAISYIATAIMLVATLVSPTPFSAVALSVWVLTSVVSTAAFGVLERLRDIQKHLTKASGP